MARGEGNPQIEDGYAMVSNEILEVLAHTPLSDRESRCIHYLLRKTYGWRDPKTGKPKKADIISYSQWAKGTGITRWRVCSVLSRLVARNIFTKTPVRKGRRELIAWSFQKRYQSWLSPKEAIGEIERRISPSPKQTIGKTVAQTDDRVSSKQTIEMSSKQTHTKTNKKLYIQKLPGGSGFSLKEDISSPPQNENFEKVRDIYEQNIGRLTPFLRREIEKALARWSVEWVVDAIKEAVLNNVRKWAYAKAILERWEVEGREPPAQPSKGRVPDKYSKPEDLLREPPEKPMRSPEDYDDFPEPPMKSLDDYD